MSALDLVAEELCSVTGTKTLAEALAEVRKVFRVLSEPGTLSVSFGKVQQSIGPFGPERCLQGAVMGRPEHLYACTRVWPGTTPERIQDMDRIMHHDVLDYALKLTKS